MKFQRLIEKYSSEYIVTHQSEGYMDGPNYVEGSNTQYQINAAIFPMTAEDVERYEGLGYTTQDIKIYIPAPIEALNLNTDSYETIELKEDDSIKYQNNDYILDRINDRTTHADFVKWIAVRDQEGDSQ